MSQSAKRLAGASRLLGETVSLRLEDKATVSEVEQAIGKFRDTIEAQVKESEAWPVPKPPQAESLMATYRANLSRRVQLLDEYGPKIVEALAQSEAPSSQKARAARAIFDELGKNGDTAVAELRAAQRRYAADMGVFAVQ